MSDDVERSRIRKYFAKFPSWAVVLVVIGLGGIKVAPFVGLALLAAGGAGIYLWVSGKATEQEFDSRLAKDIAALKRASIAKCGIDESDLVGESVILTSPIWYPVSGVPNEESTLMKRGSDARWRFACYHVQIIHLLEHHLASYACDFNLLRNAAVGDTTDEYFYKDVVSVSTKTESSNISLPNGVVLQSAQVFRLTTSGGTAIQVVIGDARLQQMTGNQGIPSAEVEKAVQNIRTMLRQKKSA